MSNFFMFYHILGYINSFISSQPLFQMISWLLDPYTFFENARKQFGNTFKVNIGNDLIPIYVVSDPSDIKNVFNREYFDDPGTNSQVLEPIIGRASILSLSGKKHLSFRKIFSTAISDILHDKEYISSLVKRHYIFEVSKHKEGDIVSISKLMRKITLRVILEILFSVDLTRDENLSQYIKNSEIEALFTKLIEEAVSPIILIHLYFSFLQKDFGPFSPWGNFIKTIHDVDQYIYSIIDFYEKTPNQANNFIKLMLDYAEINNLTKSDIRDNLITLLIAGHDTTSVVLSWFFAWNSLDKTICQRLKTELFQARNSGSLSAIYENLYLDSLVNETLRLYPVTTILFPRVARMDFQLKDVLIKTNSLVMVSPYLLHTDESIYFSPYTFNPTRFLNKQINPNEFLPFGGGSRFCLGSALATLQIKSIIALTSQSLELEPISSYKLRPIRRGVMTAPNVDSYRIKQINLLNLTI